MAAHAILTAHHFKTNKYFNCICARANGLHHATFQFDKATSNLDSIIAKRKKLFQKIAHGVI